MMPHINNNTRSLTVLYVTNTVTELYGNIRAKKSPSEIGQEQLLHRRSKLNKIGSVCMGNLRFELLKYDCYNRLLF